MLFLDDDVELHPGSVEELVSVLERDPTLFMATGQGDADMVARVLVWMCLH